MADSIRQDIIDAINTAMIAIRSAAGYETELGLNVYWWRSGQFSQDELPGINLKDLSTDIDFADAPIGKQQYILHIEADVKIASGSATAAQIRKMIADVYKAIGVDEQWSGNATRTELEGDEITIAEDEKTIGGALIRFAVIYRTNRLNPYS